MGQPKPQETLPVPPVPEAWREIAEASEQEQMRRNRMVIELLHEWLADESGYDEAVWERLKKSIEENRLSRRKRFDDEGDA